MPLLESLFSTNQRYLNPSASKLQFFPMTRSTAVSCLATLAVGHAGGLPHLTNGKDISLHSPRESICSTPRSTKSISDVRISELDANPGMSFLNARLERGSSAEKRTQASFPVPR
jgi:hypothetical protein